MAGNRLDLDRPPLELVEDAFAISKEIQTVLNSQYSRDYKMYNGFIDRENRDPDRANIFIPKLFSVVETKVPRDVKALLGTRPYIPFEAKRQEYRQSSRVQSQLLDFYLDNGGFYEKTVSGTKLKTVYGTSFMEAIPFQEIITEKVVVPQVILGQVVGQEIVERQVPRLRFRIREFAPWEIYVDPYASGLARKGECHYVIKMQLTRMSEIIDMFNKGMYPGLDIEKLKAGNSTSQHRGDHWGIQMLNEIGLTKGSVEDGVGVLLRFESENRYIDVWNGTTVLRDMPNPFKHGMINLSQYIHVMDAHAQNKFWGIGEAKPIEILGHMLNDSWNITFDNHNMTNQGVTYYRQGEVNPDALVRTVGNKIAIDSETDRPVRDLIFESFGESLPADHYAIPAAVERMIDLGSGIFELQRGEQSAGNRTATENALRKDYGDNRQEMSVRLGEMIFMKSFGEKMLSMIDQFATQADVVDIVGEQDAQALLGLNPADLPGGFNYMFKGANSVSNELIQQRNWKEVFPLLQSTSNVLQGKLVLKTLNIFNVDDPEALEMVIPDEQLMQMQQQGAQQAAEQERLIDEREHEQDLELAIVKGAQKNREQKNKDKSSGGKGISNPKKASNLDTVSATQKDARTLRGEKG